MKHLRSVTLVAAIGACALAACVRDKSGPPGQLMVAVSTDMAIPKDVDQVEIRVTEGGVPKFDNPYDVGPTGLKIPATISVVGGSDPSAQVTIDVIALQHGKPRTLRRVITTVPTDRIALLRMPLHWTCDKTARVDAAGAISSTCPDGQSCLAGSCVDNVRPSEAFSTFVPTDVFGGGTGNGDGQCFDTADCLNGAPTSMLDSSCILPLPLGSSASNLNLAIALPPGGDGICPSTGGNACFIPLDQDAETGWTIHGSSIQIAPGVCNIASHGLPIAVSAHCPAKTPSMPTCGPWSSVNSPNGPTGGDSGPPVTCYTCSDSGADSDGSSRIASDGEAGLTCGPQTPAASSLPGKVPPSGLYQGLCTPAQIQLFNQQCLGPAATTATCYGFITTSSTCAGCLVTPESNPNHGPLVLAGGGSVLSGSYLNAYLNLGGCIALLDPSASTCAATEETLGQCQAAACGACSTNGPAQYQSCLAASTASSASPCSSLSSQATTCFSVLADAGLVSPCLSNDFNTIAGVFCGSNGGSGGPSPDGSASLSDSSAKADAPGGGG